MKTEKLALAQFQAGLHHPQLEKANNKMIRAWQAFYKAQSEYKKTVLKVVEHKPDQLRTLEWYISDAIGDLGA